MNKRHLTRILTILLMAATSVINLSSCSKDDDKTSTPTVVGTWRYNFSSGWVIMQLNSDGTGYEEETDTVGSGGKSDFTYSYDANLKRLNRIERRKVWTSMDQYTIREYEETYEVRELTATQMTLFNLTYPNEKHSIKTWTRVNR